MKAQDLSQNGSTQPKERKSLLAFRSLSRKRRSPKQSNDDNLDANASGVTVTPLTRPVQPSASATNELPAPPQRLDLSPAEIREHAREIASKTRGAVAAFSRFCRDKTFNHLTEQITPGRKRLLVKDQARHEEEMLSAEREMKNIRTVRGPRRALQKAEKQHELDRYKDGTLKDKDTYSQGEFWIGFGVLTLGVIYLLFYYPNALYSATMRNYAKVFEDGNIDILSQTVFDPHLYSNASGSTIIFLFLASMILFLAAYCLHIGVRKEDPVYRRITVVGVVTGIFCVDYIIAHVLVGKIYIMRQLAGLIDSAIPWSLSESFSSSDVWLVIVLGFIPTLCVGWVLNHLFKLREKPDPIRNRMGSIAKLEEEQEQDDYRYEQLAEKANISEQAMRRIQREIDGNYLNMDYIEGRLSAGAEGWIDYINSAEDNPAALETRSIQIETALEDFLKDLRERYSDIDAGKS